MVVRQMKHMQIDYDAVRLYFKQLKSALKNDVGLMQKMISEMTELILFEWSQHKENTANPEMRLMCARGLLMLMCLVEIGDFDWFKISLGIMTALK